MDRLTKVARETVDMIRGTLPNIQDADVFVSEGGDALIWTYDTVIHVNTNGHTNSVTGEWVTGWEA